ATLTPTASPTAGPTPAATPADGFGFLGAGFVRGSFSADGVSDDVLDTLGEEGVVRQAVCALDPCPGGLESVIVGEEVVLLPSGRMLLPRSGSVSSALAQVPNGGHRQPGDPDEPWLLRHRREEESTGEEGGRGVEWKQEQMPRRKRR
ncbi:unnamed protein product, partial [Scytosiphon promiscuus]